MKTPKYVSSALLRMRSRGYEAYLVGGCVRDMLMGKEPNDYDITTSALPQETAECFFDVHVIETGLKHGTVTVVMDGRPLEITTYRADGEYDDNRHPRCVTFTKNVRDDLSRRDFTVNAMALGERDELIDPFGGAEDIKRKIIRSVGDPDVRFAEDGLRIMRALRFASTLGFEIEEKTSVSLIENRELLKNISAERLKDELVKLVCGQNAAKILRKYIKVIGVFLPELLPMVDFDQNTRYHDRDVFEHTLAVLENCDPSDKVLRLAALFHDVGKPLSYSEDERGGHFYGHDKKSAEIAEEAMTRLKFDNDTKKKVRRLVSEHMKLIELTDRSVRRFMCDRTDEEAERFLSLMRADRLACAEPHRDTEYIEKIREIMARLRESEQRISLKTLALRGDDLTALGFHGKKVGEALNYLLSEVLDGNLKNEKTALLDAIKRIEK